MLVEVEEAECQLNASIIALQKQCTHTHTQEKY